MNEHTHDALWDEPVPEGVIRSFQPGDYQVLELGDGSSVIVSGHPAEGGTFEFFMRAIGREDAIDDPRFADIASRRKNLSEINQIPFDRYVTQFAYILCVPHLLDIRAIPCIPDIFCSVRMHYTLEIP